MSEPIQFCVPDACDGERADKVLAAWVTHLSRTRLQKAFERGEVWVEGEPVAKKHKLSAGDLVDVILPEIHETTVSPVEMPLEVLFEDEAIIAVNKACGVVVHPGHGTGDDTLVHGLLHHTHGQLAPQAGELRPGVVHRLDKETTGVIIFAKTDEAYRVLVQQFSTRIPDKQYCALVQGTPSQTQGSIQTGIRRHPTHRTRMQAHTSGRPSHTDWIVEERFERATLLRCQLHTGRTHQIRVHLSSIGLPLLGDATYGYRPCKEEPPAAQSRVYLHAHKLSLPHPVTGEPLHLEAPLPEDFKALMAVLPKRLPQ